MWEQDTGRADWPGTADRMSPPRRFCVLFQGSAGRIDRGGGALPVEYLGQETDTALRSAHAKELAGIIMLPSQQ